MAVTRANADAIRQLIPLQVSLSLDKPESVVEALLRLETAHWHYVDHVKPKRSDLPSIRFKHFINVYVPWLRGQQLYLAMKLFNRYKKTLPIYGSIILNPELSKVLLVQNVNSQSWSFPKGKQELGESESQSVIRETLEETNFLVASRLDTAKRIKHRKATFFIIENVPEYFIFVPWKRTEISNVAWHRVDTLSENPIYNIYIRNVYTRLHHWIEQRRISPQLIPVVSESDDENENDDEEEEIE